MTSTSTVLDDLQARFKPLNEEITGILENAVKEKRELSPEERLKVDGLSADRATIQEQARAFKLQIEQLEATRQALEELGMTPGKRANKSALNDMAEALRLVASGESRHYDMESRVGRHERRVLGIATPAAVGDLLTPDFASILVRKLQDSSGIFKTGLTSVTTRKEKYSVPRVTANPVAVRLKAGAAIGGSDPASDRLSIDTHKYALLVQVEQEVIDFDDTDLLSYLAEASAEAISQLYGSDLTAGSGTDQPWGVATRATVGVTGAAANFLPTADELLALKYSVAEPYANKPTAAWLTRRAILGTIRSMKDTAGRYLFNPAQTVLTPDVFDGNAIFTDPNIAATAASAKTVLFGDFSGYWQINGSDIRWDRSDEYGFDKDLVTFRGILRGGGDLVRADAVKAWKAAA